jgi:RNA polymerase sigma-70 factor (ECF subfamily)
MARSADSLLLEHPTHAPSRVREAELCVETTSPSWRADLALCERAAEGEPAARTEVAERLFDRVRAMSGYMCGGDSSAEDLAQTAMIEILRGLGSFRGESSLETWADCVASRSIMRQIKRSRRHRFRFRLLGWGRSGEEIEQVAITRPSSELVLVRQRLAVALGKLPEDRRLVMMLKLVQGYSIREIAQMTDTRPNTVRDRLRLGRKAMREMIARDELLSKWAKSRGILGDEDEGDEG